MLHFISNARGYSVMLDAEFHFNAQISSEKHENLFLNFNGLMLAPNAKVNFALVAKVGSYP